MNIPEYNTDIATNLMSNMVSRYNESILPIYDYMYDITDQNSSYSGGSQHLETMLQQFFSKMSDNQTIFDLSSGSPLRTKPSPSLFFTPSSPSSSSSSNDANSFRLLSIISLWLVLLINPVVILFGVIGNLLTIYILVNCHIAKLPVSFYTIMLNISDTLNLLVPVLVFWLDNCFNRTPERGYFRDKSNFLCKALTCPDQLFAALSAWYMCAISFNRWYSVWRPSSFFSRQPFQPSRITFASANNNLVNENNCRLKRPSSTSAVRSPPSSLLPFCFPVACCYCVTNNIKYRQHVQAFRSIGIITFLGILCCLYPIFMHELGPVISTNQHVFDLTQKTTHTYVVVWKRCYYSRKHEYAYDILGIILSCLLHVLPLTFVAAMNIMIIVRLRQRQRLMSNTTHTVQPSPLVAKKRVRLQSPEKSISFLLNSSLRKTKKVDRRKPSTRLPPTHKDQSTLTDPPNRSPVSLKLQTTTPKRHRARDRTITIMLVSVALSYLILTIPYRFFWSYNVYIKHMHPEKLNSSVYLLKMYYIDHVLRTIRNIHYGTNFIFFIFLSKTFRRKFQQLVLEKCLRASNGLCDGNTKMERRQTQERPSTLEDTNCVHQNPMPMKRNENCQQQMFPETPSLIDDAYMNEERLHSIVQLEQDDRVRDFQG